MDPRFTRLEEKITFVEHQLGELDGVVRDLGSTLDAIARKLDHVADRLQQQEENQTTPAGSDGPPTDEQLEEDRPPHW